MSISRQNLTIVIVTLKSESVIHQCIKSIDKEIPIIVVENSNNEKFKNDLETRYSNLKCILSKTNLGMGAANNKGIKAAKTDYVYILNPDVTLKSDTLEKIFFSSKEISEFSILTPINSNLNFPNWKKKSLKINFDDHKPLQVDSVDGFSMLLNKKNFKENIYFDENIFLFLENDDLCLRTNKAGGTIFILPTAQINHIGAKSADLKFVDEIELSRNWHWIWSKFYFNKKHFGIFKAFYECLPTYVSAILKYIFYFLTSSLFSKKHRANFKKKIYFNRAQGFYFALVGKSSSYRPNLRD